MINLSEFELLSEDYLHRGIIGILYFVSCFNLIWEGGTSMPLRVESDESNL